MTAHSHSTPVKCPRCEQGRVCAVRINALGTVAQLCDECDALWVAPAEVGCTTYVDFGTYMAAHGRAGVWDEVTVLGGAA